MGKVTLFGERINSFQFKDCFQEDGRQYSENNLTT